MQAVIDITIDSLGGLGDGIANLGGKPVYVGKACAGDRVRARIVHENQDAYQAVITEVLHAGEHRRDAPCRYFAECGGCSLQQLVPPEYQHFKKHMLAQALSRAGFDAVPEIVFLPPATRRRVEFKVGEGKLAFHAPRSHTPVLIEECLILTPTLQALIAPINAKLATLPPLFAISLTQADRGIDMVLIFRGEIPMLPPLDALARELGVARISARSREGKPQVLCQIAPVEMVLGGHAISLPPDAFLQATAEGQEFLTQAVLEGISGAKSVVDLFCGIGTYSFPASAHARVHAVESDTDMVAAVRRHAPAGMTMEKRDLFKHPLTAFELGKFDAAIINPPRMGAKAQSEQLAASGISRAIMVSCNPATFARDAAIFKKQGFQMGWVKGLDQFVWSQHLEIAAMFTR